jgi:hypothetical protein
MRRFFCQLSRAMDRSFVSQKSSDFKLDNNNSRRNGADKTRSFLPEEHSLLLLG